MFVHRTIVRCLISAIMAGLPAWAGDEPSALGSVRGTTHTMDGLPLSGVRVLVHRVEDGSDATSTTGADGSFFVGDLKLGQYQIYTGKAGFASSPTTLQLTSTEAATHVDLALRHGAGPWAAECPARLR